MSWTPQTGTEVSWQPQSVRFEAWPRIDAALEQTFWDVGAILITFDNQATAVTVWDNDLTQWDIERINSIWAKQ